MTSPISDAQITAMRAAINAILVDTAVIKRRTRTSDGAGGGSVTYTAHGTATCRIRYYQQQTPVEQTAGVLNPLAIQQWSVTLPALTDVQHTDRLTISGTDYEVTGVREPGSWELCRRVLATTVGTP